VNRTTPIHKDDELCGFFAPKNTRVIVNILGIHHNPKYWKDPKEFKPERWNDIQMKDVKYQYLPFSLGPRE
jgi:cytochrome P450